MSVADFDGAKLALFVGTRLVVLRRDIHPGLAWAGYLDLPGGGREGHESPEACVLRETREEIGLKLGPDVLVWRRFYNDPVPAWFFVAHVPMWCAGQIMLGNEGQDWHLMDPDSFVRAEEAIPHFRDRVAQYLRAMA